LFSSSAGDCFCAYDENHDDNDGDDDDDSEEAAADDALPVTDAESNRCRQNNIDDDNIFFL
jgi:hypothetical protein